MSGPTLSPSQTIGPFFERALLRDELRVLVSDATAGTRIRIEGRVVDGDGQVVPDAMVEIWQANSHGRYNHPLDRRPLPLDPGFTGFGRCGTDDEGRFWFETVKPGAVPFDQVVMQAPHVCVTIFARGLLNHVSTRVYFGDEPSTPGDPILNRVPASRRKTLIAQREGNAYRWDVILQGKDETVFLNV
jgi:protocatechuate 3,4-dioxygenase alpha subunit